MPNPYETLGVAPNASHDDIRKAYRKAAKETHPDLNPGKPEAEKRFKEINAAYDIVGDAEKRKAYYDRFVFSQKFAQVDPWSERVSGKDKHEFRPMATVGYQDAAE